MKRVLIFGLISLVWTGAASAALELLSVGGAWINPEDGEQLAWRDVAGQPQVGPTVNFLTDTVSYGNREESRVLWGTPHAMFGNFTKQSGLGFTGIEPRLGALAFNIEFDVIFQVGQLRHFNYTIKPGTAATETELGITLSIAGETGMAQSTFTYDMFIEETQNIPGDEDASADIITFENNTSTQAIVIDGKEYELELIGFTDEETGEVVSAFISYENQTSTSALWGRITAKGDEGGGDKDVIPAPGALLLASLGAGFVGWLRRQRIG